MVSKCPVLKIQETYPRFCQCLDPDKSDILRIYDCISVNQEYVLWEDADVKCLSDWKFLNLFVGPASVDPPACVITCCTGTSTLPIWTMLHSYMGVMRQFLNLFVGLCAIFTDNYTSYLFYVYAMLHYIQSASYISVSAYSVTSLLCHQ